MHKEGLVIGVKVWVIPTYILLESEFRYVDTKYQVVGN